MKELYLGQGNAIIISMKKFLILVLIIPIFLMAGCLNNYVPVEDYSELQSAYDTISDKYVEANQDRIDLSIENKNLKSDVDNLENETEKYQVLVRDLNSLLKNVYYGYASNEKWISDGGFNGFSMEYKGSYYIITAGHMVENEYGKFINFKFKPNFSDNWIYPKLLIYDNNYMKRSDYAVFYSDVLKNGFRIDDENDVGKYILGNADVNINIIREVGILSKLMESGSPIIDYEGEAVGISTTDLYEFYTPIRTITEAIDNLE